MRRFIATLFILMLTILPASAIKIGLMEEKAEFNVGSSKGAYIINEKTGKTLYTISPMEMYTFKAYKGTIGLFVDGKAYNLGSTRIVVKPIMNGFLCAKKKWYRGVFVVQK